MKRWTWVCALAAGAIVSGCNESVAPGAPGTPGNPTEASIIVLNSLAKTLQQFNIIDGRLVKFGTDIQLGPNFDGVSVDFLSDLFVTTTSAFGGSQIIFGSLTTGEQLTTLFPGPSGSLGDAGKPTLVLDGGGIAAALVPARAENSVYLAFPGQPTAQLVANGVGEFIERSIPAGDFIVSLDANLDDVGGTFQPLGPPRMVLNEFFTGEPRGDLEITGTTGATEFLILQDNLLFLAGGGFDPVTFQPLGDGEAAFINVSTRGIQSQTALGGNGLGMEAGRDGLVYIVRTKGPATFETDVLVFNFAVRAFERGPTNPLQPKDSDGSDLSCRVVTATRLGTNLLCATFEASSVGRLVLLGPDGAYRSEIQIGAGAVDIGLR